MISSKNYSNNKKNRLTNNYNDIILYDLRKK